MKSSSPGSWTVPLLLLLGVVVASAAAPFVDHDGVETALGMVAGALTVSFLFVCTVQLLGVRARRRARDQMALDGLEPLRAARRDSRP